MATMKMASISALAACLLAGCAGQPKTSEIFQDKQAYLDRYFTVASLPSDIRADAARLENVDLPFHRLIIETDNLMRKADTRTAETSEITEKNDMTFINVGGGNIQAIDDVSNNGIPVTTYLYLSYLNLTGYSDQTVNANSQHPYKIGYWHGISDATPGMGHPQEHSTYAQDKKGNGFTEHYSCTTAALHPASEVASMLPGQALDVDCTAVRDGILYEHEKLVFLTAYGIYIRTEKDFANYVYKFTITGVHAE